MVSISDPPTESEFSMKRIIGKTAMIHWADGTLSECSLKVLKKWKR